MIKIRIPASTANIGSGFDSLGIALNLYNYVEMEPAEGCFISSADGSKIPTGEDNLIYLSAKKVFEKAKNEVVIKDGNRNQEWSVIQ